VSDDVAENSARSPRTNRALGVSLRRAWIGYQLLLDREMAAAGFADRGFPDGRVLRLCAGSDSVTASEIGRDLGITRQGAGKIVAGLRDRGYVTLDASTSDGREKTVTLTRRARDYLEAQRSATSRIERELRKKVGDDVFESLWVLLDAINGDEELPRMRDYVRRAVRSGGLSDV
jgi:DNA-binding MarR family transcriptional regulator